MVEPEQLSVILDADPSQLRAIGSVQCGSSLVIQGPPGTGKSRSPIDGPACRGWSDGAICFAEKAALDVVYKLTML